MKFGKVDNLEGIDFSFPNEPDDNHWLINDKNEKTRLFTGTTAWACKEWVGNLYPNGIKDKDFLYHYGQQFDTIELNTTYYRIPSSETVEKWVAKVPVGFRFCPKIPQEVSHFKRLKHAEALLAEIEDSFSHFGNKLGTTFLQLPPDFGLAEAKTLLAFLEVFPAALPLALEFRDPSWFVPSETTEEVWAAMKELGVGTVITDVAGRRDVLSLRLTSKKVAIRFVGNGLHPTDFIRAGDWARQIAKWAGHDLDIYFFLHQPDPLCIPETGKFFGNTFKTQLPWWSGKFPNVRQPGKQISLF